MVNKLDESESVATVQSVNGMGAITLPADGKLGSGDYPTPLNKKNNKVFKRFKEFAIALKHSEEK